MSVETTWRRFKDHEDYIYTAYEFCCTEHHCDIIFIVFLFSSILSLNTVFEHFVNYSTKIRFSTNAINSTINRDFFCEQD